MKKLRLPLLLLGFAALLFLMIRKTEGPKYRGYSLEAVVRSAIYYDHNPELQPPEARRALRAIGADAIPYLLQEMRAKDSSMKLWVLRMASKQKLFRMDSMPAQTRRAIASYAWEILGERAEPAIPKLIELLDIPGASETAVRALTGIVAGSPAIQTNALHHTNAIVRCAAVQAIGNQMHSGDRSTIALLVQMLEDSDSTVRAEALLALPSQASDSNMVAAVARRLDDASAVVRHKAVDALYRFKRDNRQLTAAAPALPLEDSVFAVIALPGLLKAREHATGELRSLIEHTIANIDPGARATVEAAIKQKELAIPNRRLHD